MILFMAVKHFPEATHPKICLFSLLLRTHSRKNITLRENVSEIYYSDRAFLLTHLMSWKRQDLSLDFASCQTDCTSRIKRGLKVMGGGYKINHRGREKERNYSGDGNENALLPTIAVKESDSWTLLFNLRM